MNLGDCIDYVNNFVEKQLQDLKNFDRTLENKQGDVLRLDKPLGRNYDTFYNGFDRARTRFNEEKVRIERIKGRIQSILDSMNELTQAFENSIRNIDEGIMIINNKQHQFGLHGVIKSRLGNNENQHEMTYEQQQAFEEQYREMSERGGKRKNRKTRKNRKMRKK